MNKNEKKISGKKSLLFSNNISCTIDLYDCVWVFFNKYESNLDLMNFVITVVLSSYGMVYFLSVKRSSVRY